MRSIISMVALICCISGCNNMSPRQEIEKDINNQKGKIGHMEDLTNSMKTEIAKLQNEAEIQNSRLEKIQQGLANIQNINENDGIQILSGNGGLMLGGVLLCIVVVLGWMVLHYRLESIKHRKTAEILTKQIVLKNDPELEEQVFQAIMYTNVEENLLSLFKQCKNENKISI